VKYSKAWASFGAAALFAFVVACGGASPPSSQLAPSPSPVPPAAPPVRVLMITTTAAFRHDSIPTAQQVMTDLAARSGEFTITVTEDLSTISEPRLAQTHVLMFALTTGELPLSDVQKSAIVAFVNNGGGFIGIHSATDTLYQWPDYGRIVGAYFKEHPWTQEAAVTVEDRSHPITASLGPSFRLLEEYYTFQQNPRASVHVLLSLDAASVGAQGDYPLAWTQTIGGGRSYYNALGHFESTWRDAGFQNQIRNAIRWAASRP
jgi:type 1 glutamine amidotransferase